MTVVLTPDERVAFKRCRRAWDFGFRSRRGLEPVVSRRGIDPDRAIRDALAVYYFPGMWDWPRPIVLPLVSQELDRSLQRHRPAAVGSGGEPQAVGLRRLLSAYLDWAPDNDHWAPILVEVDYRVDLPDPDEPDMALRTSTGDSVRYEGRADLLAMDEYDAYWIVRHKTVQSWTPLELLVRDEESVAACWAWERFYLGMTIAGTIYNELRIPSDFESDPEPPRPRPGSRREASARIPHSEGSGGGRSLPQHRRLYAQANEPKDWERTRRDLGPWFRHTWIRRDRAEIDQAGRQLADDVLEMSAPTATVYPSPSESMCTECRFEEPCEAMYEGRDPEPILAAGFRPRPVDETVEGRLGGATWSIGRGAAPPRFPGPRP